MAITVKGEFAEEMETAETGGCILHIVHFKQEHCHIETLQCNIVLFPTRGYLQGGNTCLSRVPQPTPRDFPKSGGDPVNTGRASESENLTSGDPVDTCPCSSFLSG